MSKCYLAPSILPARHTYDLVMSEHVAILMVKMRKMSVIPPSRDRVLKCTGIQNGCRTLEREIKRSNHVYRPLGIRLSREVDQTTC